MHSLDPESLDTRSFCPQHFFPYFLTMVDLTETGKYEVDRENNVDHPCDIASSILMVRGRLEIGSKV